MWCDEEKQNYRFDVGGIQIILFMFCGWCVVWLCNHRDYCWSLRSGLHAMWNVIARFATDGECGDEFIMVNGLKMDECRSIRRWRCSLISRWRRFNGISVEIPEMSAAKRIEPTSNKHRSQSSCIFTATKKITIQNVPNDLWNATNFAWKSSNVIWFTKIINIFAHWEQCGVADPISFGHIFGMQINLARNSRGGREFETGRREQRRTTSSVWFGRVPGDVCCALAGH